MIGSQTKITHSLRVDFQAALELGYLASAWAREIARLIGFLAVLMSIVPGYADAVLGVPNGLAAGASAPSAFATINRLGESDQQAALRVGQLLARRRTIDPFGNTIRGPYRGLPPVAEHPTAAGQPVAAAPAVYVPTVDDAIKGLSIGAVNVGSHEFLIGSRSVREGDLLVLESGSTQFVVWVQNVGVRGVLFCDIDRQKHLLKPFGSGPRELSGDSVRGLSGISQFLNKDTAP
jgi:hypothetical protein